MNIITYRLSLMMYLFIVLFTLSGCDQTTASYRMHPEFVSRSQSIRSARLVSPDVKIYEISAGGLRELMDDWSAQGKDNLLKLSMDNFKQKGFVASELTPTKDIEAELENVRALYRVVSGSIQLHTFGPQLFPEKVKNFDYSIGSIENILKACNADSLILIHGSDEISTQGRKAMLAAGAAVTLLTGRSVASQRAGVTSIEVALIDRTGAVLWYKPLKGQYDLRETDSAKLILSELFKDFPEAKR
ncbi:MAG: hypothetical protein CSYNP_00307 [Syntrophus sp. SKADARSKE-3]|nr:hypothetical protein [Syntrophus sp. SKADARSKE-3]